MAYKAVFKRVELKYLLTAEQKKLILSHISPYMELDEYGRTTIRNVYFDTESYRLIRRSIEKPVYKEKIRIRSYCRADGDTKVFVELKRKFDGTVYRVPCKKQGQIVDEINYFMDYYKGLRPVVFLSYEREAFKMRDGSEFRVTFDENILCRQQDVDLGSEAYGENILPEGLTLMELKSSGAIPLWMVEILSREKIYKTSFSKYGTAYGKLIFPEIRNNKNLEEADHA